MSDFHRAFLRRFIVGAAFAALTGFAQAATPATGRLEAVAVLPTRPATLAPAGSGRIFAAEHPLDSPAGLSVGP